MSDKTELEAATRMSRDLASSSIQLSDDEARFLVDSYYQMQENRKRTDNQVRSMNDEPHNVLAWLSDNNRLLENQIKRALDKYSDSKSLGRWARSQVGIGPVIAAGLLAHIDVEVPTAGHIWAFAGLDPTKQWEKGKRRPWNAALKTLCWKIGESFVKFHGNEDCYYGHVYAARKKQEIERNDQLAFSDQAEAKLLKYKIGKTTDAYKAYSKGLLPPAHIHRRACRYAVKLFLAHYHEIGYELALGKKPPLPYAIAILGHSHLLKPP